MFEEERVLMQKKLSNNFSDEGTDIWEVILSQ